MLLDALLPQIAVHAAQAPEPTLARELRSAAADFCRRTKTWRKTLTVPILAGTALVALALPADAVLADVISARWNDCALEYVSDRGQLYRNVDSGPAAYLTQTGPLEVQLLPAPNQDGTLLLRAALAPSQAAASLEDALVEEFADALLAGTLSRVLRVPGTAWHNPQMAGFYAMEYERLCEAAKLRGNRDTSPVQRTVRYGGL